MLHHLAGMLESIIEVLVQSEDSTVFIVRSRRTMHFSTTRPPRPSLLMFVTNGPALLKHPVIATADTIRDIISTFFILSPE